MSDELDLYRPCVGICLLNKEGKVFVAERLDAPKSWQMPQGGINENEDPYAAALRELEEETSVSSVEFLARSDDWLAYDLPKKIASKIWGGRYKGQRQIWYAFRLTGPQSQINIQTEHAEFSRWKWVTLAEAVDLIIPFKRDIYCEVYNQFQKFG